MNEVYVGLQIEELEFGQVPANISKVILHVDSKTAYAAGDDTGITIEKDCPFASQAMAEYVLGFLSGVIYRPYSGTNALLDPAAEIGDGVTIGDTYSVIAQTSIEFDKMCVADISAPSSDDLDDEFPYLKAQKRKRKILENKVADLEKELEGITPKLDEVIPKIDEFIPKLEETMPRVDEIIENWDKLEEVDPKIDEIIKNWDDLVAEAGVLSFNGRKGIVVPEVGDYTEEISEAIRYAIYASWEAEY